MSNHKTQTVQTQNVNCKINFLTKRVSISVIYILPFNLCSGLTLWVYRS